mgnify:CR=1 FL=1
MKYEEDTFICPKCGYDKVGQLGYVNVNTDELLDTLDPRSYPAEHYRCFNDLCDEDFLEEVGSYTKY